MIYLIKKYLPLNSSWEYIYFVVFITRSFSVLHWVRDHAVILNTSVVQRTVLPSLLWWAHQRWLPRFRDQLQAPELDYECGYLYLYLHYYQNISSVLRHCCVGSMNKIWSKEKKAPASPKNVIRNLKKPSSNWSVWFQEITVCVCCYWY